MPDVADHLRSARRALSEEEPARALPLLREAVSAAPDSFDARMLLGVCLWMCGQHEEGLRASQRAVDLSPQRAEGHYNLGVMLQAAGRLEEATQHFRTALELNPNYPRAAEGLMTASASPERQPAPAAGAPGSPGAGPSRESPAGARTAEPVEAPAPGDAGEPAGGPARADENAGEAAGEPERSDGSTPAEDTGQTRASEGSNEPTSDWYALLLEALKGLGPDST
jgi:tetratricopeptide (TPR) repeat protein